MASGTEMCDEANKNRQGKMRRDYDFLNGRCMKILGQGIGRFLTEYL